jgi:hypothetical protein
MLEQVSTSYAWEFHIAYGISIGALLLKQLCGLAHGHANELVLVARASLTKHLQGLHGSSSSNVVGGCLVITTPTAVELLMLSHCIVFVDVLVLQMLLLACQRTQDITEHALVSAVAGMAIGVLGGTREVIAASSIAAAAVRGLAGVAVSASMALIVIASTTVVAIVSTAIITPTTVVAIVSSAIIVSATVITSTAIITVVSTTFVAIISTAFVAIASAVIVVVGHCLEICLRIEGLVCLREA